MNDALTTALEKVAAKREKDAEAATRAYRDTAHKLAANTPLDARETKALADALEVLGLTADDLTADVAAIGRQKSYAKEVKAQQARVDEMTEKTKGADVRIEELQKAINQERINYRLLEALGVAAALAKNNYEQFLKDHARVLSDASIAPRPPKPAAPPAEGVFIPPDAFTA